MGKDENVSLTVLAINLRAYGVERTGETANLAKMNLFLNNIRGEITEGNSYYADTYNSYENFDYVMANPPFNVDVHYNAENGNSPQNGESEKNR